MSAEHPASEMRWKILDAEYQDGNSGPYIRAIFDGES